LKAVKLSSSAEDYLLAISLLREKGDLVKVRDIGKILNISAPAVSEAIGKLSNAGLVKHQKHGDVELTAKGTMIARDVYLRYETLHKLLFEILNVPPEVAERDAKGMKHALSKTSQAKMIELMEGLSKHQPVKEYSQ
jgi:DtxR family Mn-dependent transcriptional regulator